MNVIRDSRLIPDASDEITTHTGFAHQGVGGREGNAAELRFNSSSSMISLYPDGLNRINNDLRDWLGSDQNRLYKGPFGVDAWIDNQATRFALNKFVIAFQVRFSKLIFFVSGLHFYFDIRLMICRESFYYFAGFYLIDG